MSDNNVPKELAFLAAIATIIGTCITAIALVNDIGDRRGQNEIKLDATASFLEQSEAQEPGINNPTATEPSLEPTSPSTPTPELEVNNPTATEPSLEPTSPSTPTPELQPLRSGAFTISATGEDDPEQGFNFEQGISASMDIPADVIFSECESDINGPHCRIDAGWLWEAESVPLEDINEPIGISWPNGSSYSLIKLGNSYIVSTFNGRLAKFRVVNIVENPPGFDFVINWIYQPNNRQDFSGP